MGKLEDKTIDEIGVADLDDLLGREENQSLELKEALDGIDTYELAKDLSSIANAGGGYFIVGPVQDKSTEQCIGFKSINNAEPIFKKIKDVAAERIQERLAVEPVLRTTGTGESLILARIPKPRQLCAVINRGRPEYWRRVGRDKHPMTHPEIMAAASAESEEQLRQMSRRLEHFDPRYKLVSAAYQMASEIDRFLSAFPNPANRVPRTRVSGIARMYGWNTVVNPTDSTAQINYQTNFGERVVSLVKQLKEKGINFRHSESHYLQPQIPTPWYAIQGVAEELREGARNLSRTIEA